MRNLDRIAKTSTAMHPGMAGPFPEEDGHTTCNGQLSAESQQASFITDGEMPSKARGATRRRRRTPSASGADDATGRLQPG